MVNCCGNNEFIQNYQNDFEPLFEQNYSTVKIESNANIYYKINYIHHSVLQQHSVEIEITPQTK